jgi:hypothetical protein
LGGISGSVDIGQLFVAAQKHITIFIANEASKTVNFFDFKNVCAGLRKCRFLRGNLDYEKGSTMHGSRYCSRLRTKPGATVPHTIEVRAVALPLFDV